MVVNTRPPIPAAQYLRMSREDQQYSIANQGDAIETYAKSHGYSVIATYADSGKSGIEIKHRAALRRLLADVMSGHAQYKAVLVYDVSRWGRFQDVDEAAHYEFLCTSAGVPVRYCAEQFENDGSLPASIMKALKRTMAAEYSRELSVKVSAGQRRVAQLGFRVVGGPGYGLRRMIIAPDGRRKLILKQGERKAIKTDRAILVFGPKREVDCIRLIFELASNLNKNPTEIARELNAREMPSANGHSWDGTTIYRILKNEKYTGCNIYGRTTQRLRSRCRVLERHLWVRNTEAFIPIVDRATFDRVQMLIKERANNHQRKSDDYLLKEMRRVLGREGKLTKCLLERQSTAIRTYIRRFGSFTNAYKLAGFQPSAPTLQMLLTKQQIRSLHDELYARLKQLFADRVRFISLPGQQCRQIVEIDGRLRVSIYLCRSVRNSRSGEPGWLLSVRRLEREFPALLCTVDRTNSTLLSFYVCPPLTDIRQYRAFRESQPWLSMGRKLEKLDAFCDAVHKANPDTNRGDRWIDVGDIRLGTDNSVVTLANKEVTLGAIGAAIFKMLALNAGRVISQEQLSSVSKRPLDYESISAHVNKLRVKLGSEAGDRIRTVVGSGYTYVYPDTSAPMALK